MAINIQLYTYQNNKMMIIILCLFLFLSRPLSHADVMLYRPGHVSAHPSLVGLSLFEQVPTDTT